MSTASRIHRKLAGVRRVVGMHLAMRRLGGSQAPVLGYREACKLVPGLPPARVEDGSAWTRVAARSKRLNLIRPGSGQRIHRRGASDQSLLLPSEECHFPDLGWADGTQINTLGMQCGARRNEVRVATFFNVFLAVGAEGYAIFDRRGLFASSMALVLRRLTTAEPKARFEEGLFIGDWFNRGSIAHFALDHLGRALLWRATGRAECDVFHATLSNDYARTMRNRAIPTSRELQLDTVYGFDRLHLLSSSNLSFQHPARFADPRILHGLRALFADEELDRPDYPRKIYISRRDAGYRRVVDEERLEIALEGEGFVPLQLARMPPLEQLRMFRNAETIVAPHGAGLTSMFVCKPATSVIELFNPDLGTAAFAMMAHGLGLHYAPLVGEPAGPNHDFRIGADAVLEAVASTL